MTKRPGHSCFIGLVPFLATFFILVTIGVPAQEQQIDSLTAIAENPDMSPEERASACYRLAKIYSGTDKKKSLYYALKLLPIAKARGDLTNALNALDLIINLYDAQNDFENSLKYGRKAVDIAKESGVESDIAYFSGLCGGLYIKTGDYFEALQSYQLALSLSRKNNWVHGEASFLNNIGGVYYLLGDELTALDYYIKAYNLKEQNKNTERLIPGLINIGGVYSYIGEHDEGLKFLEKAVLYARENKDDYYVTKALISIGDVYVKQGNYEKADEHYKEALEAGKNLEDLTVIANVLSKIGKMNIKTGQESVALEYARKALDLSEEIDYPYGISIACQQLGAAYLSMKDYPNAGRYLLRALAVSRKINAVENQLDNYKSLSVLYRQSAEPDRALTNYTRYVAIKDSIFNAESHKKYNAVKAKYEVEKKQQELDKLKLENEIQQLQMRQSRFLLMGAVGLIVLIILFVILIFRQYKVRSLQRTIRLEQKLLRSQLNPHFIFNALTAIQRFIFEKSTLLASDYLGKFSRLIRFILNSSASDSISLKEELDFLENYLDLQAVRFDNKFSYEIHVEEGIRTEDCYIPPLLIQPVVENAVEHGVSPLEKDGLIRIELSREHKHFKVVVTDNGVGRAKAAKINARKRKNHKSLSTSITKERLLYLNKRSDEYIFIETIDLTDEQGNPAGTKVVLQIPFSCDE